VRRGQDPRYGTELMNGVKQTCSPHLSRSPAQQKSAPAEARAGTRDGLKLQCSVQTKCSVQEVAEFTGSGLVVFQLPQRLVFDLADAFAGHVEALADFFQRVFAPIYEALTELQDQGFAFGQLAQGFFKLLAQQRFGGVVYRRIQILVGNKIAVEAVFFRRQSAFPAIPAPD
jgi:hypothetical protein